MKQQGPTSRVPTKRTVKKTFYLAKLQPKEETQSILVAIQKIILIILSTIKNE